MLEPFSNIEKPCGGLANASRSLWVVSCGSQSVGRLETATGKPVATITTGAHDALGNALAANFNWTFITADIVPPFVNSITPNNGATNVAIVVSPLTDGKVEGTETVSLTLSAGAGYAVGSPAAAVVTIADADKPVPAYQKPSVGCNIKWRGDK